MIDGGCGRVLVVEDDDDLRGSLTHSLQCEGYEVEEARNGQEALDCLHSGQRPGCILLDLMMPVMNGWQFRDAQQQDPDPKIAEIPVIVLSAVGGHVQKVQPLDAVAFMRKPFDLDVLLQTIQQHCQVAAA
ncbi:MAG: response regulator [Polyangiales bacterium]